MKRYRTPKARPGELKAKWGKLPHEAPDLCSVRGEGVPRCDGALLHWALCGKRARLALGDDKPKYGPPIVYDASFLEELEKRGYDITTIRFSVQKKAPNAELRCAEQREAST